MTYTRPSLFLPAESCAAFFRHAVVTGAKRPALVFEDQTVSYGELARRVEATKRHLIGANLGRGSHIGISLPTTPAHVVWALAALDLGATVVPIYDSAPATELRLKCLAAPVNALAVNAAAIDRRRAELAILPAPPALLLAEDEPQIDFAAAAPLAPPALQPDDLAFMPFSSGTMGEPKLILLSHRNVLASRLLFAQATGLHAGSVLVHFLPLSHVYGWMALTAALGVGAKVVLHARYDFDRLVADVERHSANAVFAVSQTIIDLERAGTATVEKLKTLRWINTGSAPLAPSLMRTVATRYGFPVTTGYGLTEAAPVTHTAVERADLIDVNCVGYAAANTTLRLVDPDNPERSVPHRGAGELVVAGPQVSIGYRHANGKLDRSSWLADGGFRTGDLVEFDALMRICIVGRIKNIIKYKGYSVAPAELEALLADHPDVLDCTVIGRPDPEVGEVPTAFVVARKTPHSSEDDIIAYARERVAPQRCIRDVVFVDEIPRSSAGKVQTQALLERV